MIKKFNIITSSLSIANERKKELEFSLLCLNKRQVMMVQKKNTSIIYLNKKVCA
ncbi:hypothetical protein CPJCM30710_12480 [Clostridium polyendosporum]|uniref:Uncharacterized protein n=1 Tax=Clostridium polyendosporum TaxID=69208 RepID=A0A919RYG5_9CLOT|nr:hypothetical protein [Clostridium polyendosporum]GIM28582.1 hypothetical protein CPJCM30710_12480 [Clostridium polyendosporum]